MTKKLTVELQHASGIPGWRWSVPVGWQPANEVAGAEYVEGFWWAEDVKAAGLICFVPGQEGTRIEVGLDDLLIARPGSCRVIGSPIKA